MDHVFAGLNLNILFKKGARKIQKIQNSLQSGSRKIRRLQPDSTVYSGIKRNFWLYAICACTE